MPSLGDCQDQGRWQKSLRKRLPWADSYFCTTHSSMVWPGVLSGYFSTQVSASCQGSQYFHILTCSLRGKHLEWLLFVHLNTTTKSLVGIHSATATQGSTSVTWLYASGCGVYKLTVWPVDTTLRPWDNCIWTWGPADSTSLSLEP